jgi:tetratricopeptide (TPR) repeat protein
MTESASPLMPQSVRGKVDVAVDLKACGTAHLNRGEVSKAVVKYRTVFAYLDGLVLPGESMTQYSADVLSSAEAAEVIALKNSVYLNLALCYLKLGRAAKVVEVCDKALALDAGQAKACFRKGSALISLKRFDEAKSSLLEAARLAPQDRAVRSELERWRTEHEAHVKALRERDRAMFGGIFVSPSSVPAVARQTPPAVATPADVLDE